MWNLSEISVSSIGITGQDKMPNNMPGKTSPASSLQSRVSQQKVSYFVVLLLAVEVEAD